jgi:hypothetical protein
MADQKSTFEKFRKYWLGFENVQDANCAFSHGNNGVAFLVDRNVYEDWLERQRNGTYQDWSDDPAPKGQKTSNAIRL